MTLRILKFLKINISNKLRIAQCDDRIIANGTLSWPISQNYHDYLWLRFTHLLRILGITITTPAHQPHKWWAPLSPTILHRKTSEQYIVTNFLSFLSQYIETCVT